MQTNLMPGSQKKYSKKPNQTTKAVTRSVAKTTRIVTCSMCGRPIAVESAYCVIGGPVKKYYCNKEEYEGGAAYLALRDKYENGIKDFVKFIINGEIEMMTFNVLLNTWLQDASYQKIYYYLYDNQNELRETIVNKQIDSCVQRLRYLSAVIINNIVDYKPDTGKELVTQDSSLSDYTDYNIYAPRMLPRRNLRRSMEELEEIFTEDGSEL